MSALRELDAAGTRIRVLVDESPFGAADPVLWPSFGEYPCYDTFLYQALTGDEVRNQRFRSALEKSAPGKVVLDIGTGQDLLWARESLSRGARHVLAMEVMEASFRQAARRLRAEGLTGHITLLHGVSTEQDIQPKADVCIADVIGSVAGAEGAAVIFTDARRRHLAPGGTVIPHRAVTHAAAVSLTEVMGGRPVAFAAAALPYLCTIFDWNGAPFDVRLRIRNPVAAAAVSDHAPVEILELNGDLRTEQETRVTLAITRPGQIDGVLAWLELWCDPALPPLSALGGETSWASVYFPLFDPAVPVAPGDALDLTFRVRVSTDGLHPDYGIEATVHAGEGGAVTARHSSPHHGRAFRRGPVYRRLFPEACPPPGEPR
jgi:type I protein arginine methyltransferase